MRELQSGDTTDSGERQARTSWKLRLSNIFESGRYVPQALWALITLLFVCSSLFCYFEIRLERVEIEADNTEAVSQVQKQFSGCLAKTLSDLFLIADDPVIAKYLNAPNAANREALMEHMLWWSRHETSYFKIRIINSDGVEWFRVNNNPGLPVQVRAQNLQDKSKRYFFREAIRLGKGEAYVSPLDLNVDQGKVEEPPRPTFRVCTPLFDGKNRKRGILVLNYDAREMLNAANALSTGPRHLQVLNSDGYWLKGPSPEMEWGFLFEARRGQTYQRLHPQVWKHISGSDSGSVFDKGSLIAFSTIHPLNIARRSQSGFTKVDQVISNHPYAWKIVSDVPADVMRRYAHSFITWTALVDALLLVPLFAAARSYARIYKSRAIAEREMQQQARMLDLAEDAIYILEWGTFRLLFMNGGAEKQYGWKREESLGKDWLTLEAMLKLQLPRPIGEIAAELLISGGWESEVQRVSRDGREKTTLSRWALQRDANGTPTTVLIISHDITARKKAEEDARRAQQEAELFLNSIPSLLIILSSEGCITTWNPAAEVILGVSAKDACGKTLSSCGVVWDGVDPELEIIFRLGNAEKGATDHIRIVKDGEKRLLGLRTTRVRTGYNTAGYLIVGADITERIALETQLRQAQKMEAIGQLAAGIAHEINTPTQYVSDNTTFVQQTWSGIAKLISVCKCIKQEAEAGVVSANSVAEFDAICEEIDLDYLLREVPQALDQSLEGLQRVSKIVRAMKEFSHPGQESKKAIDINHAIETTITVARNEWKYIADVETHFDEALPMVPCLPGEFNQVILNLVVNAAQAIAQAQEKRGSSEKGKIVITTLTSGEWAEVKIQDTGCGIPAAIRNRIFEPFFTTKEVGKGTGQGLALAHNVVVQGHSGKIWFESEEGVGTTFFLQIPLQVP